MGPAGKVKVVSMQPSSGSVDELRGQVFDLLGELLGHELGLPRRDGSRPLEQYGLDSFGLFEFILAVEKRFGIEISDELFDVRRFRTVNSITGVSCWRFAANTWQTTSLGSGTHGLSWARMGLF